MATDLPVADLHLEPLYIEQKLDKFAKKRQRSSAKFVSDKKTVEELKNRASNNDKDALFELGQFYFENGVAESNASANESFADAFKHFADGAKKFEDIRCYYQMGVMCFDGLGIQIDQSRGCELMRKVLDIVGIEAPSCHMSAASDVANIVSFEKKSQYVEVLIAYRAAYNLGRAYYCGLGVTQSDEDAERLWLLAANEGNPMASVKAQTCLGFFYCDEDHRNLDKAFFWHSEACGNGSLESQCSLGVMYLLGLGVQCIDYDAAFVCLNEAAQRGSIYSKAFLCQFFYQRKLFTKSSTLAYEIANSAENLEKIEKKPIDDNDEELDLSQFDKKGLAIACFIYGRCLHKGLGVQKDEAKAKQFYSKSFYWDPDLCAKFQNMTQRQEI